jgi:hypothetical protein
MVRKSVWSYREQRQLIELARLSKSLDDAAKTVGRSAEAIKKMAKRLGVSFKPKVKKK